MERLGEELDPAGKISASSTKLSKDASPIVALEVLCLEGQGPDDVAEKTLLAIHEDGTVVCHSGDLKDVRWTTRINPEKESFDSMVVEQAVLSSVEQVQRAILKDREDMLASIGSIGENPGSSILVVTVRYVDSKTKKNGLMDVRLFKVANLSPENSLGHGQALRELCSLRIPEAIRGTHERSRPFLHVASATLYQSAGDGLNVYDLSGLVPRLAHKLALRGDTSCSALRLSSSILAYTDAASISVIDLPFCSQQGELNLADLHISKKDESPQATTYKAQLLSHFPSLDLVIALHGRKLLAIQMSLMSLQGSGSRKRKRHGLLADSIGRGSSLATNVVRSPPPLENKSKSLGEYLTLPSANDSWDDRKAQLALYSNQNDVKGFETAAASLLDLEILDGDKLSLGSATHLRLDQTKVRYVLSRIFLISDARPQVGVASNLASARLSIRCFPRALCKYFIENSLLTTDHIEKSLNQSGDLPPSSKLVTNALIQVLAEWDASLELLSLLVASRTPLNAAEVVHAVVVVTCNPNTITGRPKLLAVDGGETHGNNDMQSQLTNGEPTPSPSPPSPSNAENVHSSPTLAAALKRLYATPSNTVAKTLKRELTTTQLRLLVDALRIEIARSGWLSPYEDNLESPNPHFQDNDHICHIGHLLNCTIDSIGTGGWVLGTSKTDDFNDTADTIAYMKAEISAALEGIEEATYLKGMLNEILLSEKHMPHHAKYLGHKETQLATQAIKPITVSLQDDTNLLPLGLKPASIISTTKVAAGGELRKRSARDIGRQKSKMVGKYSFERIVI